MKKVYFVHQDQSAANRGSDGVELCIIPEFHDNKIYFYCHEYVTFWKSIEEVGDFDKSHSFNIKNEIRPASLIEISNEALCGYISTIKEYEIENGKLLDISYIHLPKEY